MTPHRPGVGKHADASCPEHANESWTKHANESSKIWVVGADKWRNPDEDLPRAWAQDIETTIQMPTHMTRSATQPALPVGACQSPA